MYNSVMKKNQISKVILTSAIFGLGTKAVYADPPKLDSITTIFTNVMRLVFPVGALVAVAMIVFGGYMWMISGGDAGKVKQAQGVLTWAVIGLVFLGVFTLVLDLFIDFLK